MRPPSAFEKKKQAGQWFLKNRIKMIPAEILTDVFISLKQQMQMAGFPKVQMTWRTGVGFFNIRIQGNSEPEITTIVLKHGKSIFDFDFAEESEGTKRLFDLIDMRKQLNIHPFQSGSPFETNSILLILFKIAIGATSETSPGYVIATQSFFSKSDKFVF